MKGVNQQNPLESLGQQGVGEAGQLGELPVGTESGWIGQAALGAFRLCPPFVAARLTTAALKALGARIGRSSIFWSVPRLSKTGRACQLLTVGDYCGFNARCYFELEDEIRFGDHVAVGQDAMFLTKTHDTSDRTKRAGATSTAPIEVGDGVWLGARCTVLPGVKIGAGAVVGASVVVSQDVPPDMLLIGNRRISIAKWR